MMKINKISLSMQNKAVIFNNDSSEAVSLAFEYLRVFSPAVINKTGTLSAENVVSHKKNVLIQRIESVGKHGFRFIFDDEYSAIYSPDYLQVLISEQQPRWQHYLAQLKASGHSREAMIDIKQL